MYKKPFLAYTLAHEGGTVWCLEWCPSGCYQNEKSDKKLRMGLLAAACSDGCVYIYSLPFPENENSYTYKTREVLKLVVNTELYLKNQQNWQVTKLCWSKEAGHK